MPTTTNGVLRLRPRINVPRGYTGNEPQSLTRSAPLDVSGLDGSVPVYSGQPLFFDGVSRTFTKPAAGALGAQIYFALQDGLDTDVQSCGKITGFSALGDFEIETAWVDVNGLAIGLPLMIGDAVDGVVHELKLHDGQHDNTIVGYVTDIRDLGVGGHVAADPNGALVVGGEPVNVRGGVPGRVPEDSTSDPYSADSSDVNDVRMQIVRFRCAAR
jgi:hypothetical protein